MAEESDKPEQKSESTTEDAAKAGAVAGATSLGCLGLVTLPWSIFALIVLVLLILWGMHRLFMH